MTIALPAPIAGYFAADKAKDRDALVRHFAADAIVLDEGNSYAGHAAILAWMAASSAKYDYVVEPFAVTHEAERSIVSAHLSGNFPGSPVDVRYRFTLNEGKIIGLKIGV